MAKYEDYVSKDSLENEIQDAGQKTEDRQESGESQFEMPDRFKGKTEAEIAQSFIELEQAYSKQGNDLGRMRNTMDEYLTTLESSDQTNSSEQEVNEPVTIDDLYDDPEGSIKRAAEKVYGDKIEALEAELEQARLQTRVDSLEEKFGDWQTEVQTPAFIEWVSESPYRLRLVQQADRYDMDAAEEVLGLYGERQSMADLRAEAQRDEQLRDASLESGSAEVPSLDQPMSRTEIMNHRVRANQGDQTSIAWMKQHSSSISQAYAEGNLTD